MAEPLRARGAFARRLAPLTVLLLPVALLLSGFSRLQPIQDDPLTSGWSDWPALSADGRFLVFASTQALVPDDTNHLADIYVQDRLTGAAARLSVATDGAQADGWSYHPAISGDGRVVAFTSLASNLVPGDTNGLADVFVHDRLTGATTRVSVHSHGIQARGWSDFPDLSGDGRFVTFTSRASNLVPGDTNGVIDVFLHDRLTGQTRRISLTAEGEQADGPSGWATAISADGRTVAFTSEAPNLAGNRPAEQALYLHHRVTGELERVTGSRFRAVRHPSISADGGRVAFTAIRQGAATPTAFLYDRETEAVRALTAPVEDGTSPPRATISPDGEQVALVLHGRASPEDPTGGAGALWWYRVSAETFEPGSPVLHDGRALLAGRAAALSESGRSIALTTTAFPPPGSPAAPGVHVQGSLEGAALRVWGRVADPLGGPVISAAVSTQSGREVTADRDGWFYFDGLAPGRAVLTAEKEGFILQPGVIALELTGDRGALAFTATPDELLEEARRDLGMPYSFYRGCESPYEGCDGPFHGFYAGYCTDLVLDAFRWGLDFHLQFALAQDALAHPGHYYRWRDARNAQDMWRYFVYTGQSLPHEAPYHAGDLVFFDWEEDGAIDHVALVSEVSAQGRPRRLLDASGTIASNPSGLAAELDWEGFHERTVRAHARWRGSYGAIHDVTPPDLGVIQFALDSPGATLRVFDAQGRELSRSRHAMIADLDPQRLVPGGRYYDLIDGEVLSVVGVGPGDLLLAIAGERPGGYRLQVQTLVGGQVTRAQPAAWGELEPGQIHHVLLRVRGEGESLSFEVLGRDR